MSYTKTYRQYLEQTPFEDVWKVLHSQYGEDEAVKESYATLWEELKKLPKGPKGRPIWIYGIYKYNSGDEAELIRICADNILYRQEDLIDQTVKIKEELKIKAPEILAAILYSSTMYGFNTGWQGDKAMSDWLESLETDEVRPIPKLTARENAESGSCDKKKLRFWHDIISADYAYHWASDLLILEHKLRYNIGYWQYHQRHVGWDEDVKRMELCCSMLKIAASDYDSKPYPYVNCKNAGRYGVEITPSNNPDQMRFQEGELRRKKAYHLVFKFLENNMKRWWD